MAHPSKRILITGMDGFTGYHLSQHLCMKGFAVFGTSLGPSDQENVFQCDITNKYEITDILRRLRPDYVIHLAAVSFVGESNRELIYRVNVLGTENLLTAIIDLDYNPDKIILASSATVYGDQNTEVLDESMCPKPVNHYGHSKLAMEGVARTFYDRLNILVTRPFNYTGPKQQAHFLIPKIVEHYVMRETVIELGNTDVYREFNDVRSVCEIYERLLLSDARSEVVNVCSGNDIALSRVLEVMNKIHGYEIEVRVNPAFVRSNEIKHLRGSPVKLERIIGEVKHYSLDKTLNYIMEEQ